MARRVRTLALVAAVLATPAARAERIILVDADAELERATALALAGWDVEVTIARVESPGRSLPEASDRAAAVARRSGARAVVWTAGEPARPTLWIYDVASARTVALELGATPPFDAPTAAGIALTIKTVLRASEVAPAGERLEVPASRDQHVWLEARGGARARTDPFGRVEPRALLGTLWRPWGGPWVAAAWLSAGPGVEVDHPFFIGHAQDLELGAGVRLDLRITDRVRITPGLGVALQIESIRGTAPASDEDARARRYNPAAEAGLALGLELGRGVRLDLAGEVAARLRRQTFLVAGEEAYAIAPFDLTLAAGVAVPLF